MTSRFQRRRRKGAKFTKRDRLVVEAVYHTRYMTWPMAARLFFKTTTEAYCRRRMRILYDNGWLSKREVGPTDPDVYFLATRGRNLVSSEFGIPKDYVRKVAGVSGAGLKYPLMHVEHDLTVSWLYVIARLECYRCGWQLEWKNARMLEMESLGVQPDAWLAVSGEQGVQEAYIEFTDLMPSVGTLDQRIEAYRGLFLKDHPAPVLWFTTSASKARKLQQIIARHADNTWFMVSLYDQGEKPHYLTNRVFWQCGKEEKICLIDKPASRIVLGGRHTG